MTETIDAQKAFSGTVAPEGADVLDEAKLTAWMEANVEGFEGPLSKIVQDFAWRCCDPLPLLTIRMF